MSTSPKHADGPFSISNQSAARLGKEERGRCICELCGCAANDEGWGGRGVESESGPPDDAQCSSSLHLSVISGEPASERTLQAQDWLIY